MTTTNLNGIDELRQQIARSAKEVRDRAAAVARQADEIEAQRRKDAEDAALVARLLDQQHADNLASVNEEADQLVNILRPAPAQPDVVVNEPPAQPVVPATPADPEPVHAVPTQVAVTPTPPAQPNVNVIVAVVRTVRGWRILGWILAILLALIAYKVSGDHESFGFRTGNWAHVQHFFWQAGWTLIGFAFGGWLGSAVQDAWDNYEPVEILDEEEDDAVDVQVRVNA